MEVTFDLIDYKNLEGIKPEKILFEIFEDDEYADKLFFKSGSDFDISYSSSLFGKLQDLCEHMKRREAEIEETKFQLLKKGLFRVFIPVLMYDDLNFRDFPEEGFIASVSTEHLVEIHQNFSLIYTTYLDFFLAESEMEYQSDLWNYFEGCQQLIKYGAEHSMGLLIHMG